jgi:3-methyladenine DNA glycosylase AlkD
VSHRDDRHRTVGGRTVLDRQRGRRHARRVPDELEQRLDDLRAQASDRIPMRELFALAKAFPAASLADMEHLLDGPTHEHKVVAVSLMDFRARRKKIDDDERRALYELYRRRHDRIDTWDLVDRAAPHVVGGWLHPRSRAPLDELAASEHWYERRTAIVATWYFIRLGETADTFRIGATLAHDPVELVQKAVGGWVREAGKRDGAALRTLLDAHAATMPRTALRYAVEQLPAEEKAHYLGLRGH